MGRNFELVHSPRVKQDIKTALLDSIYTKSDEDHVKKIGMLAQKNSAVLGIRANYFSFRGGLFAPKGMNMRNLPRVLLDKALYAEMTELMETRTDMLNKEVAVVAGFITCTLNVSNSIEDYFYILPECLHPALRNILTLPKFEVPLTACSRIEQIRIGNAYPIELIKQRLLINLLI